jgi:hypothetical protein
MRVTRQRLIDLADAECQRQAQASDVVAGYLIGSLAQGEALIDGVGDIDLVLIHRDPPAEARSIIPLSADIHLDIAHHAQAFYAQPRELRIHPWWGPAIAEPLFLFDPDHFFEWAQASARGQFHRSDHASARGRAFLQSAQATLAGLAESNDWLRAYMGAVLAGGNAAACLAGPPAAGRRLQLTLEARLAALGCEDLISQWLALLVPQSRVLPWSDWVRCWALAFDALPDERSMMLHPARRSYHLTAFQALMETGRPETVAWPLLKIWNHTLSAIEHESADGGHAASWQEALRSLELDSPMRLNAAAHLEAFLDQVEEAVEAWTIKHGG